MTYSCKQYFSALTGMMILVTLSGCALFGPQPTRVEAIIDSSPGINPNLDGKPSPIVIRIYELKSAEAFQGNNFFSLYDDEAGSIGKDILAKDEIEVRPGEKYNYKRNLNDESRYIGVVAAYRDLDNAQWRASYKVPENKKTKLKIHLGTLAVSIGKIK